MEAAAAAAVEVPAAVRRLQTILIIVDKISKSKLETHRKLESADPLSHKACQSKIQNNVHSDSRRPPTWRPAVWPHRLAPRLERQGCLAVMTRRVRRFNTNLIIVDFQSPSQNSKRTQVMTQMPEQTCFWHHAQSTLLSKFTTTHWIRRNVRSIC